MKLIIVFNQKKMVKRKKSEIIKLFNKSKRGLKRIFKTGRSALVTGLLASFSFLIIIGFLDLFPDYLDSGAKMLIGVAGVVVLGLIGIGNQKGKCR